MPTARVRCGITSVLQPDARTPVDSTLAMLWAGSSNTRLGPCPLRCPHLLVEDAEEVHHPQGHQLALGGNLGVALGRRAGGQGG